MTEDVAMFHILVVDDDKNTRKYISAVLEAEGYTVSVAENGEEALEMMDKEFIDLVVLDVMMPKMDGYTFTKELREADNNLPVLMVSAKQLPADRHKGFLVGTDDYTRKNSTRSAYAIPFSPPWMLEITFQTSPPRKFCGEVVSRSQIVRIASDQKLSE